MRLPRVVAVPVLLLLLVLTGEAPAAAAGDDPVGTWPLDPQPQVVTRFDPPAGPYAAGHRGVDLLGAVGQAVRAALPGTVSFAGSIAGRGVVVVAHGATRTTYEPVTSTVAVGTPVAGGAVIGRLQSGGSHCPPRACLHWGWIEGETYLDPLRLVGAGPVRLLPLWSTLPVAARALAPLGVAPRSGTPPTAPARTLAAVAPRAWPWTG